MYDVEVSTHKGEREMSTPKKPPRERGTRRIWRAGSVWYSQQYVIGLFGGRDHYSRSNFPNNSVSRLLFS